MSIIYFLVQLNPRREKDFGVDEKGGTDIWQAEVFNEGSFVIIIQN